MPTNATAVQQAEAAPTANRLFTTAFILAVSTYFLGFDTGISAGSFILGAVATTFGFAAAWITAAVCVLLGVPSILTPQARRYTM